MSAVSGQEDAWLNGYRILPQKINMVEEIMTSEYNIKSALWESPAGGHGGDIYRNSVDCDFSINLNPLGMPDAVREALKKSMERWERYPDPLCQQLTEAIAQKYQIRAETILCGNGAADLIFTAVLADCPRKALIPVPAFAEYEQALRATGCEICYYKKREATGFQLEEDFLDLLNEDIDMVFLCSPDNPTGKLIDRSMLWKILARCETYGIRMVLDECFIDFAENATTASILADTKRWRTLFILRSLTKMHAIPGIRIGYAVTSDMEFLEKMEQSRQPWSVSIPAQVAGMASLKEGMRVKRTCDFTNRERIWMENELNKLGITHYPSDANFILMRSGINLYEKLKKQKILIRDCSNYKGLGEGYYRVCMRQRGDNQKLIDALGEILYAGQGEF